MAGLDARLVAEWHPEHNVPLRPADVTSRSNRRLWWRCAHGHDWEARVADRSDGTGCPYCSGRRTTPERSLAARCPEIAAQWHPDRNGDLTPDAVSATSNRQVWWQCGAGHEWPAKIPNRVLRGDRCPFCSGRRPTPDRNLTVTHPHVAAQWHPDRNGDLTPDGITAGSDRAIWWRCAANHEWSATPDRRTAGTGCPYCAGKLPTADRNLAVLHPAVAAEWHPNRNGGETAAEVTPSSGRIVWWRCARDHEWTASVDHRVRGQGCPYCAGKRPTPEHNLAAVYPAVAAEWHPRLNGDLTPAAMLPHANRRVWWRCGQRHVWFALVSGRVTGRGCPSCAERGPKGIPLYERAPELLDEWDQALNGGPGDQVMAGTELRAWWRCRTNPTHRWAAEVRHRVRGNGCPYCAGKRPSPERNLSALYPDVAATWHPDENGNLSPTDVLPHSQRRCWWRCVRGHDWPARVADRTGGTDCPFCAGKRPTAERNLAVLHPALTAEWDLERNPKSPDHVLPSAKLQAWWKCGEGHSWRARVANRTRGEGCPECAAHRR